MGQPDPERICTSIVERQNLSVRMGTRRFTRLTNAFSKKWENHWAAVACWFAFYNFCRVHKSIRMTPAMAAGISDHIWSVRELLEAAQNRAKAKQELQYGCHRSGVLRTSQSGVKSGLIGVYHMVRRLGAKAKKALMISGRMISEFSPAGYRSRDQVNYFAPLTMDNLAFCDGPNSFPQVPSSQLVAYRSGCSVVYTGIVLEDAEHRSSQVVVKNAIKKSGDESE